MRFNFDEVFPFIGGNTSLKLYKVRKDFVEVNMNVSKLAYLKNHRICVACGTVGSQVWLCRQNNGKTSYFFQLFGRDVFSGRRLLMTIDHIVPRSKGGPDHPDNWQSMCERCNRIKSDHEVTIEELREMIKGKQNGKTKKRGPNPRGRYQVRARQIPDPCRARDDMQDDEGVGDV